ncbi:MAG: ammonium transporter [Gemmatimonadetes bacterium]|nr:ammonium transporter [Gemmatimonadota bacterium]MYH54152.1 ammonium transporter [Gemmatimonadota bacterium]MYK67007.1 ammonium transporter [Gemmatimonadota bacterium]
MNAPTFTSGSFLRPNRRGGIAVLAGILAAGGLLAAPGSAVAAVQDAVQETAFVFNTFSFLIWGALVMWMCAGFTMLESGSVRSKNASVICLKNIGLYSIAGLTYYIVGYGLMYTDVGGGIIGALDLFYGPSADEAALLAGNEGAVAAVVENGYAVTSDWFFQMVFVATTASIVSGALAERVNLWAFFVFTAILTAFIYPVVGAWTWGGGWLAERGFTDFAGSTIVHSTGGWAALAGAIVVGPRWGKFRKDGSVKLTPPSNIPAVTLGVFILWLGWFGFNGGSQLALGSAADAVGMSNVLVNTNLAAAAGVITAILVSKPILGRTDLFAGLNGAIAGLVAITAGPNLLDGRWAILIGAVGALLCTLGLKVLERYRIDDVVGAVPAHLFAGIWGTLAASFKVDDVSFVTQLIGVASVGAFVFVLSFIVWNVLERTMGVRVSRNVEEIGQDSAELGIDAYPEFVLMVDPDEGGDYRDPD